MRSLRVIAGVVIWLGLIGFVALMVHQHQAKIAPLFGRLQTFATHPRQQIDFRTEQPTVLAVGDPVFAVDSQGVYRQVGEVADLDIANPLPHGDTVVVSQGAVVLYSNAPATAAQSELVYHHTPESLAWVLETMLPPEKRLQIAEEISWSFESHQEEIIAQLSPIIEQGLREAASVVEQDLQEALAKRSDELERIGAKYQTELVEREIVPLIKSEIWPIVERRSRPLANQVGSEIWQRASLWRFGWRYLYDVSPLPQRDLAKKEWDRFVDNEVVPVMENHLDDFIYLQQNILEEIARNRRVQQVIRGSLEQIIDDPEIREVVIEVFQEVFIENDRLRLTLKKHWQSPQARNAFRIASRRLEPTAVRIGELLFGTPDRGVSPEFARVLRNQVLGKDRRWLVLQAIDQDSASAVPEGPIQLRHATATADDPFYFVTEPRP